MSDSLSCRRVMVEKPLAAYVRVSRVGERDEDRLRSPDFQREAIERIAAVEGLALEHVEPEIDVSGSKATRKVLDEVIERIRNGELGGIVVAKLDRLSRLAPRDRVALFADIEDAGGVIISASEQLDPSTPEGRFAREVFLGVARMQWEKYRDEFDRAKRGAMARGALLGPTPFGYTRADDGTLREHPLHGPAVKEAFSLAARESLKAATVYLAAQGFTHDQGKRAGRRLAFTTATVRRLLSKRTYLGEGRYGAGLQTAIPRLVTRAVWEAAQPEPARARRSKGTFPFSGFASCAACGQHLIGARGGTKAKRMYRCAGSLATAERPCKAGPTVTAELLEGHVRAQLVEALRDHPGYLGADDTQGALRTAQEALDDAERELDDLTSDLGLRRAIGADRFRAMSEIAATTVDQRRAEFVELARQAAGQRVGVPTVELVESANLEELGRLTRGALADIVVARGRVPIAQRVRLVPKGAPPQIAAAS